MSDVEREFSIGATMRDLDAQLSLAQRLWLERQWCVRKAYALAAARVIVAKRDADG